MTTPALIFIDTRLLDSWSHLAKSIQGKDWGKSLSWQKCHVRLLLWGAR